MALARARLAASALAAVGNLAMAAGALAAPQLVAELSLHGLVSHPKWIPEEQPLFGSYVASGDGEASGALVGHVFWDLYEVQSRDDRHPTFFRGFVERDGHRSPFQIIGIYTPESADERRWRISGVITFADKTVLGTAHEPLTGTRDASTRTSHLTLHNLGGPRPSMRRMDRSNAVDAG
jgi:hypothetical protein